MKKNGKLLDTKILRIVLEKIGIKKILMLIVVQLCTQLSIIKKETEEEVEGELGGTKAPEKSEKEKLLELYKTLKDLGVNSIGDLEVKIARAE